MTENESRILWARHNYKNLVKAAQSFDPDNDLQMLTFFYVFSEFYYRDYLKGSDILMFPSFMTEMQSWIELLLFHAFEAKVIDFNEKYNNDVTIYPQSRIDGTPYIVDFEVIGNSEAKLLIECDGHDYHSTKEQIACDHKRQREIENLGYTFLRFSGSEIYNDPEGCVEEIYKKLQFLDKKGGL